MAGSSGYLYVVRLALTSISAAKTLVQVKSGAAPLDIVSLRVFQTSRTAIELWELQMSVWTGSPTAGTVTSATPAPANPTDPAALAVGGTGATGVNATVEPSGGTQTIIDNDVFSVQNGGWQYLEIPEGRYRVPQGGKLFTLKLNSAPSAASNIGVICKFLEYQ